MAEVESCGNCRYRKMFQAMGQPQAVVICKRYPRNSLMVQQNMMPPATIAWYTPTEDPDWCGEWKPVNGAGIVGPFLKSFTGVSDASKKADDEKGPPSSG